MRHDAGSVQTTDRSELSPVLETATGIALAIAQIAMSVSLAALIFRGDLANGLPRAASSFVFGGGVVGAVIAWRTQLRTAMATSQDLGAIAILATATTIGSGAATDPVVTVIVLLAVAALGTGLAMFLIGRFGLSAIVRFLPSTVVMGFLAGTGWLLMRGGLEVMLDAPITLDNIGVLFGSSAKFWLPGVAVAIMLAAPARIDRIPSSAIGVFIIASIGLFYAIVTLTSSVDTVGDNGWLVGPFGQIDGWRPVSPTDLGDADWGEIRRSILPICAMAFVSIIGVLLNVSGHEPMNDDRVDLDNEITSAGIANVAIAPIGGLIGFHMLGDTTLATNAGVRGTRVPLAIGLVSIVAALFATSAAGYVPRFIVGGLIFGVGLLLMMRWVLDLVKARHLESLVSAAIVAVVMFAGMLAGVGFGIVAASAIFLYRYSRISPIRSDQSSLDFRSTVDRSEGERRALQLRGEELRLLRVHGFLFFGSVEALRQRVHSVLEEAEVACIVLDFHHVDGVDISARAGLARLERDATTHNVVLLWSRLQTQLATDLLAAADVEISADRVFTDLDRAIEEAEEFVLTRNDRSSLSLTLSAELIAKFSRIELSAGEPAVSKGDTDRTIFIIERGACEATLPQPGGSPRRLRRFAEGSMFGEIGFRTGAKRTADVGAVVATTLLTLSHETYKKLAIEEPQLALELSHFLLDTNAARITSLTIQLDSEMR